MAEEPVVVTYEKPLERVLFNAARDCNPFLHLYESLWMLAGREDVAPLAYYVKQFLDYSDDGVTLNGAYGRRWRYADTSVEPRDQLEILIEHLTNKPESRRAVLQMWDVENDLMQIDESRDVCCNLCVMFSLRDGVSRLVFNGLVSPPLKYLDMTVINRSNDMIWGMLGANACLSGDTKFSSPEGDITIKELAQKFKGGLKKYPLYSFDPVSKEFGPSWCSKAWSVGKKPVLELEFDDGTFLKVTEDHKLFRKKWNNSVYCTEVEAGDLRVGDRVWATQIWETEEGRRCIKRNLGVDTRYSNMSLVSRRYYELVAGELPDNHDVHHKNEVKSDDMYTNLELMTKSEHMSHHAIKNHPMSSETARERASQSRKAYFARMTPQEKEAYAEARRGKSPSTETRSKMRQSHQNYWGNKTPKERKAHGEKVKKANEGVYSARFTGKKHSQETLDRMAKARKEFWERKKAAQSNHRIVGIRVLPPEEVFDFTVPGNHNAMADNGVLLHNCHFSILQEYVAAHLGVEVGVYNQITNNLHVYESNWKPVEWLAWEGNADRTLIDYAERSDGGVSGNNPMKMVPLVHMPYDFDLQVLQFVELHKGGDEEPSVKYEPFTEPFLVDVASPLLRAFHAWKTRKDAEAAMTWASRVKADDWRIAAQGWLERRINKRKEKA